MGKQGPCYHCGVTSTPLWRNGPPEKPVLCNACGSRWRTKGTLTNYMPFHSREPIDAKELKVPILKPKEQKLHKRKQSNCSIELEQKHEITDSDQSFWKFPDEDTSNRSNSGSAISCSESCSHFCVTDASDSTGPGQSHAWDSLVPSRKRTCLVRAKPSPVEKLTRDLCSILQQQSCYFSGSSEDDLLYETETPMGSLETGYGGVLIRHLDSINPEEESEASSLPDDNKKSSVHNAFSGLSALPLDVESKGQKLPLGNDKVRKTSTAQEHVKRDKAIHEMLHILRSRESPLNDVDLKDVINFEVFMRHLTQEEKQLLMKYLPSIDATGPPESLRIMFGSPQFSENLSSYRQLLMEGIFDPSFSCVDMDESKSLKKLVSVNCMKSKWVEHYTKLKDKKSNDTIGKKGIWNGTNFLDSPNIIPFKRPRDIENQNFSDKKMKTRGAKRSCDQVATSLHSLKSLQMNFTNGGMRSLNDTNEYIENDASFSPRSFFASPLCKSLLPDALQFSDESSDQGLLLDVPSIACFPEAELLCDTWKQNAGMNSQSAESGTESISYNPTSSSSSQQQ